MKDYNTLIKTIDKKENQYNYAIDKKANDLKKYYTTICYYTITKNN
jgi:hypothetical protein